MDGSASPPDRAWRQPVPAPAGDDAPHGRAAERIGDLTRQLRAARDGDAAAQDAVYAQVYDELLRLARRVRVGRSGATLSTAALVHEAYVKLRPPRPVAWEGRAHFFGVAARAMRDVLVDAARRRSAAKRGGGALLVTLGDDVAGAVQPDELLALAEALDRLGALDPRQLRVVEYRFFAGLTTAETADALGISASTVEREWRGARAWLARELRAR
jgi:RNA polymerase sigma factor (TIGR02999 family)